MFQPLIRQHLHLLRSRLNLWIRWVGLLLGLGLATWISWIGLAWTQVMDVIVIPVQEQTYSQLVDQARPLVWQSLEKHFAASPQSEQIMVEVRGQVEDTVAPLLTVTMPRAAWQTRPAASNLEDYTNFYLNSYNLLKPPVPEPPAEVLFERSQPSTSNAIALESSNLDQQSNLQKIDQPLILAFNRTLPQNLQTLDFRSEPQASLGFDIDGNQLIIQPLQPLEYSTDYTLQLSSGDLGLTQPLQLSFRTEPQYTYERDIQPLLEASCAACHHPAGRLWTSPLDTYEAVLAYVEPGDPSSDLINPRWTRRHSVILGISDDVLPADDGTLIPTPFPLDGGLDPQAADPATADPEATSEDTANTDENPAIPTLTSPEVFNRQGSPELAYAFRKGIGIERLGRWTPTEIEQVRVWIVQDQAAKNSEDPFSTALQVE